MAFLVPTSTYNACGVTVKKRIIPFGVKSSKDIYVSGRLVIPKGGNFKADTYLTGGKPTTVTIHNTENIVPASGTTKAEQYSRAMYPNENLNDVRIHFFVDEVEAWQNLLENEVSYHAGSKANTTSISIEIIGNSAKAEDNGARLAAYLLHKYNLGMSGLTTHKAWTGKYCPAYILPHWDKFKENVEKYYNQLVGNTTTSSKPSATTTECNNIYKSLGIARKRASAGLNGAEKGRCVKGEYYLATQLVTPDDGSQVWFKHLDGTYSALTDTNKSKLFTLCGTYTRTKATAIANIRKEAGIKQPIIGRYSIGDFVYLVNGVSAKSVGGLTWVKVFYDGEFGWVDKQWLLR